MEWLVILGLGVLVWLQWRRTEALTEKLAELERRLGALTAAPPAQAETRIAATTVTLPTPPAPAPVDEPLLLDTPLPAASNDMDEPIAPPATPTPAPPPIEQEPLVLTTLAPPEPPPPPAPPRVRERKLEQWLAENGLAWLGGAALALGAIYLVSVATQQAWFTPAVQLGCAVALGLALLAASEWARFAARRNPPGNPLVAAMLAGAGVVTFYVTAWAAHDIYRMIGNGEAASALALCALMLIGLSLLHGQALGVLAIAAALLAPALTNAPIWSTLSLTLFICAISGAGFVLGAMRRWAWVAAATLAGLYFWLANAILLDDIQRALALVSFASLGGIAIAFRAPDPLETPARFTWRNAHAYLPSIAIAASSTLLVWTWISIASAPSGAVAGPAWVGAMFVALAAAAVRARVAAPATFAVAVAALAGGFILYMRARNYFGPVGDDFYPFVLFASLIVAASAVGAKPPRDARVLVAASGAVGAACLTILAAFTRPEWHSPSAWAPLLMGALVVFAAGWIVARGSARGATDRALDLWGGAGAALILIGIESAIPAEARSTAHAAASFAFAGALAWPGWRIFRHAAIAAAVLAVGQALSPSLFDAAMSGAIPIWGGLMIQAVAAGLLFAAAFCAHAAHHRTTGEALSGAGVIIVLVAAFLLFGWAASGGAPARLDTFTAHALRILAVLAAGHITMARPGQDVGFIGRWRGHVLMGLGLAWIALEPGLFSNPWWGLVPRAVAPTPILNALLLVFAAPAALSAAASYRLYGRQIGAARIYAVIAALLGVLWLIMETRHLFHPDAMAAAPVGVFEAACYALILLDVAIAIGFGARMRPTPAGFTHDLGSVARGAAWTALVIAALIMLIARHPWWGDQIDAQSTALSTGLAVLAQAAAAALALVLGRALSFSRSIEPARFAAAAAAMLFAWSFGHAGIRWLYHRGAMDDGAALTGLEGIVHALWPLAFVVAASALIMRAPGRDSIRAYLYDLQAICAAAVWPVLAMAGLGLWLLFNPWWGVFPAQGQNTLAAILAPATPILAAWLSKAATRTPHIRGAPWFEGAATITCVAHLLVAATLIVRWLYHREDMIAAPAVGVEMWTYSAVLALFGAGVFGLGLRRGNALLRWIGLTILLGTTLKVFLVDTAQLAGVIRAVSAIGLALVLLLVAWVARTYRPPGGGPGDLLPITPSARRERRYGRRQRSS